MTIRFRRLEKGQLDHEVVWLAVFAATGAVGALWLLSSIPTPQCMFHTLTGYPCVTCGGTRCMRSLLAGNFPTAFAWNPLVFMLALGAGLYAIYAAIVVGLRLPRIRFGQLSRAEANVVRVVVAVVVAANWIYLVRHFSQHA